MAQVAVRFLPKGYAGNAVGDDPRLNWRRKALSESGNLRDPEKQGKDSLWALPGDAGKSKNQP